VSGDYRNPDRRSSRPNPGTLKTGKILVSLPSLLTFGLHLAKSEPQPIAYPAQLWHFTRDKVGDWLGAAELC
jgi:hypothetical protein